MLALGTSHPSLRWIGDILLGQMGTFPGRDLADSAVCVRTCWSRYLLLAVTLPQDHEITGTEEGVGGGWGSGEGWWDVGEKEYE